MQSGLTAILGAFFNPPRVSRQKPHRSQRRKLAAEQLESRFALSTLLGGDVPLDAPEAIPSSETPTMEGVALSGDTADTDPPPTDPPSMDPMDGSSNTAPQIVNFSYTIDAGWCTLTGLVVDDQDPTGQPVELNGLIFASPLVALDDYFTYRFEVTPETTGTITAIFTDMYALSSNTASVTL
jgi:hypothetical protein